MERRKRVCSLNVIFVSNRFETSLGAGGTEFVTADLIAALTDRGVRIRWFAMDDDAQPRGDIEGLVRVGLKCAPATGPFRGWRAREDEVAEAIAEECRGERPDLVHITHFSRTGLGFLSHPVLEAVPKVMSLTDYSLVCADHQMTHRETRRQCGPFVTDRECADCVADSKGANRFGGPSPRGLGCWRRRNLEVCREQICAIWTQTPFQRDLLVATGVPRERVVSAVARYQIPESWAETGAHEPSRFLFLGRESWEKGLHVLLDGYRQWNGRIPLRVISVPDDHRYGAELRASSVGDTRIEWRSAVPRDTLGAELEAARALFVPSLWAENHPMVMEYALALGVPVFCSSLPSLQHLLGRPGVNAVIGYSEPLAWLRALDSAARTADPCPNRASKLRREYEAFVDDTLRTYQRAIRKARTQP